MLLSFAVILPWVTPTIIASGLLRLAAAVFGFIGCRMARNLAGYRKWIARTALGLGVVMVFFVFLPLTASWVRGLREPPSDSGGGASPTSSDSKGGASQSDSRGGASLPAPDNRGGSAPTQGTIAVRCASSHIPLPQGLDTGCSRMLGLCQGV
jgi:hypothetical protein